MESVYVVVYYTVAGLALIATTGFLLLRHRSRELVGIKTCVVLIVGITYLVGMLRLDGIDYDTYVSAFYTDQTLIRDRGYQALTFFLDAISLPFQALMLLVAAVTLLSLRRAARYFSVSFALLLIVYFLHLAVIRDFAQFRVGFAIALAILGVTSSGNLKRGVFYVLAASVHLTSLAFILSYEYCRWVAALRSRTEQLIMMTAAVIGMFFLGASIQYLGFIDPRIEVYLEWEQESYGLPVGQFLILFFQLFILALAYETKASWQEDARMQAVFLLQILGIAAFVAFASVAIFAFRISSAVLSLYPVLLISSLAHLRVRVDRHSVSRLSAAFIFFLIGMVLISRPGSVEVLGAIGFGK